MKQSLLTILLSAASFGATQAQITITNADAPRASTFFVSATVDSIDGVNMNVGTAGTNRVWNFGTVRRNVGEGYDTAYFQAVTPSMPRIAQFPLATHAVSDGNSYGYFRVTATEFSELGEGDATSYFRYGKPIRSAIYPMTYNTTFGDTTKAYEFDAGVIDSGGTRRTRTTVDAWGSVTTPLGTFNALRTTKLDVLTGEIFGTPVTVTVTTNDWWANGYPVPVISRTRTQFPLFGLDETTATYLVRRTVSTENLGATVGNVYPNPSSNVVNVEFSVEKSQKLSFVVLNMVGQVVENVVPTEFSQGNHAQQISLDGLTNGTYLLNILNGQQEVVGAKKITIAQ